MSPDLIKIYCDGEQKEAIEQAAERAGRSISDFCLRVVLKYLKEHEDISNGL